MSAEYNKLVAQIAQITHRGDLSGQMDNFISAGTELINVRLSLDLTAPTADNEANTVLVAYPNLYLYASIIGAYEYINELDMATHYTVRFNDEVSRYYITNGGQTPTLTMGAAPTEVVTQAPDTPSYPGNTVLSINVQTQQTNAAFIRNLQDNLDENVSVKDWGAIGDGETDDTLAIQSAINTLTRGGELYFPPGEYCISDTLNIGNGSATAISTINQGTLFRGCNRTVRAGVSNATYNGGTTLKWIGGTADGPMLSINGPIAIEWSGISFNGAHAVGDCVHHKHMWFSKFGNSNIEGFTSRGQFITAYHNATERGVLVSSGATSCIYESIRWSLEGGAAGPKIGVQMGADYCEQRATSFNHDPNQTLFQNCAAIVNSDPDSKGMLFRFSDASSLIKCFIFTPTINGGVGDQPGGLVIQPPTYEPGDIVQTQFPSNFTIFNSTIWNEKVIPNEFGDPWLAGSRNGFQYTGLSFERGEAATPLPDQVGMYGFSGRMAFFGRNQIGIENLDEDESAPDYDVLYTAPSTIAREYQNNPVINNTAAETQLYDFKLKAYLMAVTDVTSSAIVYRWDRKLVINTTAAINNATGTDQDYTFRLYSDDGNGEIVLCTSVVTVPTGTFFRAFEMDYAVSTIANDSSRQRLLVTAGAGNGEVGNGVMQSAPESWMQSLETALDLTTDHAMRVTVQMGTASASQAYNAYGFAAQLV